MEEERAEKLRALLDTGLHQLYGLWDEIGEKFSLRMRVASGIFMKGSISQISSHPPATSSENSMVIICRT